jgi:Carbohydrate binding module (family 6)
MKTTSNLAALMFGMAAVFAGTIAANAGTVDHSAADGPTDLRLTPQQAMLWKYTARCALRADQELEAPVGSTGDKLKFKGMLGLAPEWREGKCDAGCQEKVSSCLAALTNQTGDHVQVSLLSAAPSLTTMSANDNDIAYPFQEGAFFGNVFSGEAYVCRGRDAEKGEQLKRFCALAPGLCSGLANFSGAGLCEQSCQMSCTTLSDGTSRCAAVSCRDPKGRLWTHPITTYLRNRIEAGNADAVTGAVSHDSGLERVQDGAQATYRHVDFGRAPGTIATVIANVTAPADGGRIEIWLDGRRRLGVLPVRSTGGVARDLTAPLDARDLSGKHDVILKFAGLRADVRLADIGLR